MSINKVILIGNVGKDPEIRTMNNGNEVALFSLATSDYWKDKATGERKERTEWHRVVVYSQGLVNIVKSYIKKGTKLYLSGSIQTRKWTDAQGLDKHSTEIVLQGYSAELQILDYKNSNNQNGANGFDEEYYNSLNDNITDTDNRSGDSSDFVDEVIDDDIPF